MTLRHLYPLVIVLLLALAATVYDAPAAGAAASCMADPSAPAFDQLPPAQQQRLDDLEHRTFQFFWKSANPDNGLAPDHWPRQRGIPYFASIAAVGFALTAYPIGVERGWITRAQARTRVLATLRFFAHAPQGAGETGTAGYHGFFYHFLDMHTGLRRNKRVEVSTIDTTWLMAGVLFDASYFDRDDAQEREIRKLADTLYRDVDWPWAQVNAPLVSMGWTPGGKFIDHDWSGYNEAMMLYILALGSPTHALEPPAWAAWTSSYDKHWGEFQGYTFLNFGPLFGHQWSESWIDFRGIRDAFMRQHHMTYFENSRCAVRAQQAYAIANPAGWTGYGKTLWGLTASNGPGNFSHVPVGDKERVFYAYTARGAGMDYLLDDGTIPPTAAVASIVFAPRIVLPTIDAMIKAHGGVLFGKYGFFDAFNLSFRDGKLAPHTGRVVLGFGWVDNEYLGIDQGPILLMLENYRSGFVWQVMRGNRYIRRGLKRAGFTGGWLTDSNEAAKPAAAGTTSHD
jgi:hypothetical protein